MLQMEVRKDHRSRADKQQSMDTPTQPVRTHHHQTNIVDEPSSLITSANMDGLYTGYINLNE